jgi:hypothetical protein
VKEIEDVADEYSNPRHVQYLKSVINDEKLPGGSDLEAIRLLKDDFLKRNLDNNLILEVGDNYVILSSEEKLRLAALITIGVVNEPVSLDGCESIAKGFTAVEMTTYFPLLRRNMKLVTLFAPKPGENSENVAKMVEVFDSAVNKILPAIAEEYGLVASEFANRGLDPPAYVGDEGGALWKGLCKVKGTCVKNKTISDEFHVKQDIRRHCKYFKTKTDQKKFETIMNDALNAATSIEAKEAENKLEKLIQSRSTNLSKMTNFKKWWWRRRIRWQKWCRASCITNASSAEVANATSVSCLGYRKRLLDVITTDCSAAVLEAAEVRRQKSGLKTVGKGPTAADRSEKEGKMLHFDRERSASAVQFVNENAERYKSLSDIEDVEDEYHVNTRDTHRADKSKKGSHQRSHQRAEIHTNKRNLQFFKKRVEGITMDVVEYNSSMTQFHFKLLDTMGYLQDIKISKESVTCSSSFCTNKCHHATWLLHNILHLGKDEPL